MEKNYKLINRGLAGRIRDIRKYFDEDHFYSSVNAVATLLCGGFSVLAIQEFINELNGVIPMDPDSPMFIPTVGLPIATFGFLANTIRHRINEDRDLRARYARQLEVIELNKQRRKIENQRIQSNKDSVVKMFLHNPYANNEEDNHKTR